MYRKPTKKKGPHKKHHRRRVSGVGINMKGIAMKVVGIAGAAFADNLAKKNFTSLSPTILGVIELGAGVFVPKFIKGPIGEGLSDGLIAAGTFTLLREYKVISGVRPGYRVPLRMNGHAGTIGPNALSVGATGRPFLKEMVGGMPSMEAEMMGALLYED